MPSRWSETVCLTEYDRAALICRLLSRQEPEKIRSQAYCPVTRSRNIKITGSSRLAHTHAVLRRAVSIRVPGLKITYC